MIEGSRFHVCIWFQFFVAQSVPPNKKGSPLFIYFYVLYLYHEKVLFGCDVTEWA